ncbi:MAG TPA: LysR family transcriptional regulator [Thermomonospora sp.]|nr:LysR family transcriptional regulator [Thermomonospora sp.]
MERLETRELAYFVAVAEEVHFGRAARRLGIAQPALSRAIQRLERRLGVPLLERGSRGVTLLPAGEVLLEEGRRVLAASDAAARRTRRAGRAVTRLVLALKPWGDGGLLSRALAHHAARPDAAEVDLHWGVAGRAAMLRDGRADVALLHDVHDLSGLDTEPLLTEPRVAVLPRGHRLAGRPVLRLADLRDEVLPRWPDTPAPATVGEDGPPVRDAGQLLQMISLGRTVAVVPASVASWLPDDLTHVPVVDAPEVTLLAAWAEGSRSLAVAALVESLVAARPGNQGVPGRNPREPVA